MAYRTIRTDASEGVGTLALDRPEALNALSREMLGEAVDALDAFAADPAVRAVLITGSERAFAAGADVAEMVDVEALDALEADFLAGWHAVARCPVPTVAAVAGHALGGGCELAMMCDLVFAADNARFGQPEIRLGTMPGLGGTQRLTRLVGRAKAMDLCLTGRTMDAAEAERSGLVSRVVPTEELADVARQTARRIAGFSAPAVRLIREAVHRAEDVALADGLLAERRAFHSLFGTADQREGMRAFLDKREARFER